MWVWGFGNHKWYKSLKSRVADEWLDKTFGSCMISKAPYSHFCNHSISIVKKYKKAIRNYVQIKGDILFLICDSKLVNEVKCEYIYVYLTAKYSLLYCSQYSHMCQVKVNVVTCEFIDFKIVPSPWIYMTNCSIVSLL